MIDKPYFTPRSVLAENTTDWRRIIGMIGVKPVEVEAWFPKLMKSLMSDETMLFKTTAMPPMSALSSESALSVTAETILVEDMVNIDYITLELQGRLRGNMELVFCCRDSKGKRHFITESDMVRCFPNKISTHNEPETFGDVMNTICDAANRDWFFFDKVPGRFPKEVRKELSTRTGPERLNQSEAKQIAHTIFSKIDLPYMLGGELIVNRRGASLEVPELENSEPTLEEARKLNPEFGVLAF